MELTQEVKGKALEIAALLQAQTQLNMISKSDQFNVGLSCPDGYKRGIDFYTQEDLPKIMGVSFLLFFHHHGYFPNLIYPLRFDEKIVWSKFFRPFKVPQSGNKLLTSDFIPDELNSKISCPEIVWHSPSANLPDNKHIEPGDYYLKSNHGCGNVLRITYPLSNERKNELEKRCAEWLSKPYGRLGGEWWYNVFTREVMLEKAVTSEEGSLSWNYYVFSGEIGLLSIVKKAASGIEYTCFDHNFEVLDLGNTKQIEGLSFDRAKAAELASLASEIGKDLDYVRVDLIDGSDGLPYLNEMTFSPSNGNNKIPPDLDFHLGNKWEISC